LPVPEGAEVRAMKKNVQEQDVTPSRGACIIRKWPLVSGHCMILGGRLFDFRMAGPVLLFGDNIGGQESAVYAMVHGKKRSAFRTSGCRARRTAISPLWSGQALN